MAITVVGGSAANTGTGTATTQTVTLPAGAAAGDTALLIGNVAAGTAITMGVTGTWTTAVTPSANAANTTQIGVWTKVLSGDGSTTGDWAANAVQITASAARAISAGVVVLRGGTYNKSSTTTSVVASSSAASTAITPDFNDSLLVAVNSGSANTQNVTITQTAPSGYTEQVDTCNTRTSAFRVFVGADTKQLVGQLGVSQGSASAALSGASDSQGAQIEIKLASTGATVTAVVATTSSALAQAPVVTGSSPNATVTAVVATTSSALARPPTVTVPGAPRLTMTFEEGTNGSTITTASGADIVVGTPTYSTTEAVHGSLGMSGVGAAYLTCNLTGSTTFSLYGRLTSANPTGAGRIMGFYSTGTTFQGAIRTQSVANGSVLDICNSSITQVASSSPFTWTLNQPYRLDAHITISGTSTTVEARFFIGSNTEGSTADVIVGPVTYTATATVGIAFIGNNIANWSYGTDTVRITDGVATWPTAYAPASIVNAVVATTSSALAVAPAIAGSSPNATISAVVATTSSALARPPTVTGGSGFSSATLTQAWGGAVTTSAFKVNAKIVGATALRLAVSTSSSMTSPTFFGSSAPDSEGRIALEATGLSAGTQYYYKYADTPSGGVETLIGTVGKAKTLPTSVNGLKVALGACATTNSTVSAAFDDIRTWGSDFMIHTGDFHYNQYSGTDESIHRARWDAQIAGGAGIEQQLREVPTFYCTSDHEAGLDNADSNNVWTQANINAYKVVVPNRMADTRSPSVGRYQSWVVGRVRFIMLDIRNMDRSAGLSTDDSSKTMLGATQKAWLKTELIQPEFLKVILSDVGWMGAASTANGEDKWWSYATERTELINYIATNKVNVELWHGDTHALGYSTPSGNAYGGFPVLCSAMLFQDGGGRNLGEFTSYWNNTGGAGRAYVRISFTDDGTALSRTAVGYDPVASATRWTNTVTLASVTGVKATATALAQPPTVTTGTGATVTAVRATATAGSTVPTVNAAASLTAVVATSIPFANAPTLAVSSAITAVVATSTSLALAPTQSGTANVTAVVATTSSVLARPPTLTFTQNPTVTAVVAVGFSMQRPPSGVSGSGFTTVNAVAATATTLARAPTYTTTAIVTAVKATATALENPPTLQVGRTITAVVATATALARPSTTVTAASVVIEAFPGTSFSRFGRVANPPGISAGITLTSLIVASHALLIVPGVLVTDQNFHMRGVDGLPISFLGYWEGGQIKTASVLGWWDGSQLKNLT